MNTCFYGSDKFVYLNFFSSVFRESKALTPFFWAMQSLFDLPTSLALIDNS